MAGGVILDLGDEYVAPTPEAGSAGVTLDLGDTSYSVPKTIASSMVTGLTDIPLAGTLFEKALTEAWGVDKASLEEMARVSNSSYWSKGLRFITEFGAEMLLTGGAFALGRKLAVSGLRHAIPAAMAAKAGPEAVAAAQGLSGKLGVQAGRVAARALDTGGVLNLTPQTRAAAQAAGLLESESARTLAKLGITTAIPKPALERGAEILGSALGVGSYYGAADYTDGASTSESIRTALTTALFVGGIESTITLGAKALFKGARERDVAKLLKVTEEDPASKAVIADIRNEMELKLGKLHERLVKAQGADEPNLSRIAGYNKAIKTVEANKEAFSFFTTMDPLFRSYLTDAPRDRAGAIQTFLLKIAKTTEQMGGEMGPATAKVVELGRMANLETVMQRGLSVQTLAEWDKMFRMAMGATKRGQRQEGAYLLKALRAWQTNGDMATVPGVKDPELLHRTFQAVGTKLLELEDDLAKYGLAPPDWVEAAKAAGKVPTEWPIVLNRLERTPDLLGKVAGRPKSEEQLIKQLRDALVRLGKDPLTANQAATKVVFGDSTKVPFMGAFRSKAGRTVWSMYDETSLNHLFGNATFDQVVAAGAPIIKDPIVALEIFENSVARRVAYAKRFGPGGYLARGPMFQVARAQGASVQLYQQMVEAIMGSSYGTVAEQAFASAIVNTQTASRMGLGVLPNMWQWMNQGLTTGPGSLFDRKGLREVLKVMMPHKGRTDLGSAVANAAEASAIHDTMIRGVRETFLDPYFRTPMGQFSDTLLLGTGFTWFERFNRLWSFVAGSNYAQRTLVKATEGRLRGATLDIARRRFHGMGQNLDELVAKARLGGAGDAAKQVERLLLQNEMAILKDIGLGAVRQSQFLPDKTRLPTFWNTPTGRVAFQFKSFALNQTRLVRDAVINEAAKGNLSPLLYMTAAFPLGGEVAYDLRQLVKEGQLKRPNNLITRMVENMAAVGAFALAGDIYRAATWGPEQLGRLVMGPTAEDFTFVLSAILTGEFDRVVERANNLPTYQAAKALGTVVGTGIAITGVQAPELYEGLRHYLSPEEGEGQGYEPLEAPTLGELAGQQRR